MKSSQDGKTMKSVGGHTAIPNWSGFIYQGLCAAYVALRLCYEEPEKAQKCFLSLDAYEDFAILDEKKKCLFLHQCKCYGPNSGNNFSNEFGKMRQRKEKYVENGNCKTDAKLYFHCNQNVTVGENVVLYQYIDRVSNVNPDEIEKKLGSLIDKINEGKDICINKGIFIRRLYFWIDNKVLAIHSKIMNNPGQTSFNIASGEILPINNLYQTLSGDGFSDLITKEEAASYIRIYYLKQIDKTIEIKLQLGKNINKSAIANMKNVFACYPSQKLWELFTRLNPQQIVSEIKDIGGWEGDNVKSLFGVVDGVKEYVSSNMCWKSNGVYLTPSTLSKSEAADEICYEIINNRANLNVLFDYRWLVADTNRTVQSIGKEVPNILKNTEDRYDNTTRQESDKIFNPQDIGILTIDDKNNENYK
ncbi:MAG: hypothetical protein LKF70_01105 [Prevotella sp.]|nr:hypothetical protein [Prevotella sp.]MCH4240450.1 hypothetical protein [Prevotella sp.]